MGNFVHLRIHTEYSVQDGITQISPLIKQLRTFEQPAAAITDLGNLFGFVKFYKKCRSFVPAKGDAPAQPGIKPIVGCDLYMTNDEDLHNPYRILLLAHSHAGYHRLCELITRAWLENANLYYAAIRKEWLLEDHTGLIVLSGGKKGDIGQALLTDNTEKALELAQQYQQQLGDCFYIELQRAGFDDDEYYVQKACDIAQQLDIPVVATHPVQFLLPDDFQAHEVRCCIASSDVITDKNRPRLFTKEQYLKSTTEMQELFHDIPDALTNTIEIAKRCNVELVLGKPQLPLFPTPAGVSLDDYLVQLANAGLQQRLTKLYPEPAHREQETPRYQARLDKECDTIIKMGFSGYFLIVQDFINWGKQNGVPVGPGRGSGAGSLVAYSLGITDLDPLAYDLLFERFLNPERVSMPDFDIDFCQDNRDKVIEYVKQQYGHDAVSQIATFGTMGAKAVVRDVGRVLGRPYGLCNHLSKLIPQKPTDPYDLARTLKEVPEFIEMYNSNEDVRLIVDIAKPLEGLVRNIGMHAGGVLIAPGSLTDFCPLYCQPGHPDSVISQYDKGDVEDVGLVKFDFLGLRNLTILDWATRYIHEFNPHLQHFTVDDIPFDDQATFDLFSSGNTTAIFQLESPGMKQLLKKLQPSTFEDIIAVLALYRPGPLESGMLNDFVERKHGRAEIDYFHPDLESTLSSTYGVIVYQEQVMLISQIIGGYSLGGADLLRRAMGKKKPEEMAKQRVIFEQGAVAKGYDAELAVKLFDLMEKFAGYGFNKSHSAAYALIAWQTAWLKVYHPAEFMAATLSSDMDSEKKISSFLKDSMANGLTVLPVDINQSYYRFKPVRDQYYAKGQPPRTIRYGLGAIKGVGESAVHHIEQVRQQGGDFADLYDFCLRIDRLEVPRRMVECMIKAGAFDSLNPNRAALLYSLPAIYEAADQRRSQQAQVSLFDDDSNVVVEDLIKDVPPWSLHTLLMEEKDVLGVYFSHHLFEVWRDEVRRFIPTTLSSLQQSPRGSHTMRVAGVVQAMRYLEKKDEQDTTNQLPVRTYFITLSDATDEVEIVLPEAMYKKYANDVQIDRLVIADLQVQRPYKAATPRVKVEQLFNLDTARNAAAQYLLLELKGHENLEALAQQLIQSPGQIPVCAVVTHQGFSLTAMFDSHWKVALNDELLESLRACNIPAHIIYAAH